MRAALFVKDSLVFLSSLHQYQPPPAYSTHAQAANKGQADVQRCCWPEQNACKPILLNKTALLPHGSLCHRHSRRQNACTSCAVAQDVSEGGVIDSAGALLVQSAQHGFYVQGQAKVLRDRLSAVSLQQVHTVPVRLAYVKVGPSVYALVSTEVPRRLRRTAHWVLAFSCESSLQKAAVDNLVQVMPKRTCHQQPSNSCVLLYKFTRLPVPPEGARIERAAGCALSGSSAMPEWRRCR